MEQASGASADHYREALADSDAILYIAKDKGRVYNLIPPPFLEIFEIMVDMNAMGRGLAALLLNASEDYARDRRIKTVQIALQEFNQNALRFYQGQGFGTLMRKMIEEL